MRRSSALRRRRGTVAGALALVVVASLSAHADPKPFPAAGCDIFTDAAGDATPVGDVTTPQPPAPAPAAPSATVKTKQTTNSANFDITGVSYRATDNVFSTVIRVPGLAASPDRGTGDTWFSNFTVGRHVVQVKVSRFTSVPGGDTLWDGDNPNEWLNTVSVDGTDEHDFIVAGGDFDLRRGFITLSVDRRSLEKFVGQPLGDIKALSVSGSTRAVTTVTAIDTATAPDKLVVRATDNVCF